MRIHILEEDDIQAMIDASKPGDVLIFQGYYSISTTVRFKSNRRYISNVAVFEKRAPFDEPIIRMTGEPQRLLQRIISWIRRHLHLLPSTRIFGFVLLNGGMEAEDVKDFAIMGCTMRGLATEESALIIRNPH